MRHLKSVVGQIIVGVVFLVCSVVLSAGSAVALEAGEVFDLGRLTITATRQLRLLQDVSATVSIIEREELETVYCNMSLGEVLSQLCGVSITSYGRTGSSLVAIRGSTASQVLVLVDGRPVNEPSSGQADLSLIELANVERIEVVRGPFSALYGSSALGGVINIVTRSAADQGREGGAEFVMGTPPETSMHLFQSMPLSQGGLRMDFELGAAEGTREHTKAHDVAVTSELAMGDIHFSAGYQEKPRELPGSISWLTPNASQYDRIGFLHVRYEDEDELEGLQASLFVNDQLTVYEDPDSWTKDSTMNLLLGGNIQTSYIFSGIGGGVIGVDLRQEQVDVVTADGVSRIGGLRTLGNIGTYLNHELSIGAGMRANLGVRYDTHSKFGGYVNPRAGIVIQTGPLTWLRASLGTAFRAPTTNDLYWYEDWGGGMGLFGNENLKPEASFQYELGLEHAFGTDAIGRVTWFSSEVDQLINWVETGFYRWEAENIDTASIHGVETEVQIDYFRPLVCKLSYQYLDAKDTKEYKGKYIPYKPCYTGHVGLELPVAGGQQLTAYVDYVGGRYADRENTTYLDPYWLVGALLRFPVSGVFFRVDNLLGEEYEVIKGYPVKGTQYSIGIKVGA